jgi:hypothetical protein
MGTVDVRFEIVWRDSTGRETVLASAMHTFVGRPAGPNQYDAIAFETDLSGIAAAARPGDLLLLRFTVPSGDNGGNYTPNGDGPLAKGRYPSITLPP